MLRASIEYEGTNARLAGISSGSQAGDAGIEHGELLTAFVEAAAGEDVATLRKARNALRAAAGSAALVDAAAVIGNFERMVRIADGTGIPLDGLVEMLSDDFRQELGLEAFESRRTRRRGFLSKTFGPVVNALARIGFRFAGRRGRTS
jgi:hypothetical protein